MSRLVTHGRRRPSGLRGRRDIFASIATLARASTFSKRGFAWQAFILPEIWLFLRGLPIDALVWIVLMISALVFLPQLYRSKGWTHLTDVQAPSLLNALMTVPSQLERPAA